MHHPPKYSYCGLQIVMSNPSRFDTRELLSGTSGSWFSAELLRPEFNRYICDISTVDSYAGPIPNTRVVLCLGARAQREVMGSDAPLGAQRGSVMVKDNGIVYMSSYLPVDCLDPKDWERIYNPHLNGGKTYNGQTGVSTVDTAEPDEEGDDYETEKSRHGKTSRRNFRFWLQRDVNKAKQIIRELQEGRFRVPSEPEYRLYPSSAEVIQVLRNAKGGEIYLDIETDAILNIRCFGFSINDEPTVYVVPLFRHNYTLAYSNTGNVLRALAMAMANNTCVAHNGSGFDWIVLFNKYRIPMGKRVYDTMVAQHRCYPEVEKSLGHCVSLHTYLPFHKDEGIYDPKNDQQERQLWLYCGKDVFAMREVKKGITKYAEGVKGLKDSIEQANASIRPYLTTTFTGIRYDKKEVETIVNNNDRRMMVILKWIEIAIGKELYKRIQGKSDSGLPGSNKQCVTYFHEVLGYPVLMRSQKTGKPKLDEKVLLKLAVKFENPVIGLILLYRGLAKESGTLKFTAWKGLQKCP